METSGKNLKRIKEMMNYILKSNVYPSSLKDYVICEYVWDDKKYDVDYYLDRQLYVLDKEKDELVDYDQYDKHWIKFRIIAKDFLYYKDSKKWRIRTLKNY